MASNTPLRSRPAPLPTTIEDWHRQLKAERTLNDRVEDVHVALLSDDELRDRYLSYLYAVYDEQAVEGSLSMDNGEAAGMIREKARSMNDAELGRQKKATIVKALNIVLRRYNNSRKERRNMIGGEVVASDDMFGNS